MIVTISKDKQTAVLEPIERTSQTIMTVGGLGLEGRRSWVSNGLRFVASRQNIEAIRRVFDVEQVIEPQKFVPDQSVTVQYEPKTTPFAKQAEALEAWGGRDQFALFMEQGTGKTKVAIDIVGQWFCEGKITGVLVFTKKGVHRQWVLEQFPTHCGVEWCGGYWNGKRVDNVSTERRGLEVLSVNYDCTRGKGGVEACEGFATKHQGTLAIICDESQDIKDMRSQRSKKVAQIRDIGQSPYRLILTGTPVAKNLVDEFCQLHWLNSDILGFRYVTGFRNRFCVMGGYMGREIVGTKNLTEFRAAVDPWSYRCTKEEMGLAPKAYSRWTFALDKRQKAMMADLRDQLALAMESGEVVSSANAAVFVTKAQQIANGFAVDEDGKAHLLMDHDKNPRLNAMTEFIEAHDGKLLIWARFRQDIQNICDVLADQGIGHVQYHGGTKDADRAAAVQSFLDPQGARIFVSNPQAGGTGLNLQGLCTKALYYSNGYSSIDRWQSEDRIHRHGAPGICEMVDLVAKGSPDARILANLRKKKDVASMAVGDLAKLLLDDGDEVDWTSIPNVV